VPANGIPQLSQSRRNEVNKSPPKSATKTLSQKPETSNSSNPKPNSTTQEQPLEKLKKDQIQWRTQPRTPAALFFSVSSLCYMLHVFYIGTKGCLSSIATKIYAPLVNGHHGKT